jgi:hypothetical protein
MTIEFAIADLITDTLIVLTGVPSSVPEAADNKRAWARKHLGEHVRVICCLAKEKCKHAKPGDILIDDWESTASLDQGRRTMDHPR